MQKSMMKISLTIQGPLLTKSSGGGELGLNLLAARKGDKFYLPATLVVGKLRQALEEIQDIARQDADTNKWFRPDLDVWLGKPNENGQPKSKQLFFSDFELINNSNLALDRIRDRIKIDDHNGAIEKGQIVMIENPFLSGESYIFSGEMHFFSPAAQVENILKHIKTGFNWFSQIGAMKSIGFGQVTQVNFPESISSDIPVPGPAKSTCPNTIGMAIKPRHSFCLSGKPLVDNLFSSESIIPGGALIGCIATTWSHLAGRHDGKIPQDRKRKILADHFSKIRITHGFPSNTESKRPVVAPQRPVVAPLSTVKINNEPRRYDVALLSKPCLINNAPLDFALDWKDDQDTLSCYPWPYLRMKDWGWPAIKSELRVHTAIDRERYRSEKSELFAYEQIVPEETVWYAQLDLSRIKDEKKAELLEQLKSLVKEGIIGLGKTKTIADIQFMLPEESNGSHETEIKPFFASDTEPVQNNTWVITLQTDTLLGSPDEPDTLDETAGAEQLHAMYHAAWDELSCGTLKLLRYFARQKLSGGRFKRHIFNKNSQTYKPWLLTEAGSVFVLQATGEPKEAVKYVNTWLEQGLPLTPQTCRYYDIEISIDTQWQQCPFVPQNGYGEIAVNIQVDKEQLWVITDEMAESKDPQIEMCLIDPPVKKE
ncbi:MAG: hypothetical protein CR963_00100 [Gammaproteobacteria bacterium]|nr:MAG: hypothetical protein CR963_00100 [Gammaproteobacteria bacterium]